MSIAGKMDERITIEHATRSISQAGEQIVTYIDPVHLWAKVEPERGSERLANSRLEERRAIVITTRYEQQVRRGDRVTWRGDTFRVQGEPEMLGRERFKKFVAAASKSTEVA